MLDALGPDLANDRLKECGTPLTQALAATGTVNPVPARSSGGTVRRVLHVDQLTRSYGAHTVVDAISFDVPAGTMLALLGPNGAGKSTTMRVLSGALPPSAGTFSVDGLPGGSEAARRATGYVPDTRGLFPRLTASEHLDLAARLARVDGHEAHARELIDLLSLAAILDAPASTYSHGQSRRLSVAMAVITRPKLLLVDEPFDGVDPVGVDVITGLLDAERQRGAAIVLTTHLLDAAAISDHVAIFKDGVISGPHPSADLIERHGSLKNAWIASQS